MVSPAVRRCPGVPVSVGTLVPAAAPESVCESLREPVSELVSSVGPCVGSPFMSGILGGAATAPERSTGGPLPMTYVIAQPCVDLKDRACIEECPVDCIYEGKRSLYIHPDECVDCGACEPVCPVEAIYYEDDVPEQWADYYNANVEFFNDLGSPGGAAKLGVIDKDHPLIEALPPQEHDE